MAINEAVCSRQVGATKVGQELQSMAAACALTAWRLRETSDSLKRTRAKTAFFIGRVRAGKYSFQHTKNVHKI